MLRVLATGSGQSAKSSVCPKASGLGRFAVVRLQGRPDSSALCGQSGTIRNASGDAYFGCARLDRSPVGACRCQTVALFVAPWCPITISRCVVTAQGHAGGAPAWSPSKTASLPTARPAEVSGAASTRRRPRQSRRRRAGGDLQRSRRGREGREKLFTAAPAGLARARWPLDTYDHATKRHGGREREK